MTILGLLGEGQLHGYELRKRLTLVLGPLRPLSYGSLYPALHRLAGAGLIDEAPDADEPRPTGTRRARVQYRLTPDGQALFDAWVNDPGPDAWDDDDFAARLAFFSRTEQRVRLRILQGRRTRLEERLMILREATRRGGSQTDRYARELQQHGVDGIAREVSWLDELIDQEQQTPFTSPTSEETP